MTNKYFCSALVAAALVVPAKTAFAQESGLNSQLEEITVTARRRNESLQDIPMAISAFTAEQLEESGANNLVDIARFTPGVQFQEQGVQEPGRIYTSVRFRGLGGQLKQPYAQVGSVFLDGIYMSSGVSSLGTGLFERVEIVKGPSSALFGRNTFGGAVNFITPTPSLEEYSGSVNAQIAGDSTHDVSFSHEGPIMDGKLGYRVFLRSYETGGQYTSFTDGGALGEESTDTGMLTLYAEPSENFSVKFRALYAEDDDGSPAAIFLGNPQSRRANGTSFTNCQALNPEFADTPKRDGTGNLTDFFCGEIPIVDADRWTDLNTTLDPDALRLLTELTVPGHRPGTPRMTDFGLKREQTRFALRMDWQTELFGGATITSITAQDEETQNFIRDFDLTNVANWVSTDPNDAESFSQELRITSPDDQAFTWLVGANYVDQEFSGQFSSGETVAGDAGITVPSTGFLSSFDVDSFFGNTPDGLCPCSFPPVDELKSVNFNETIGVFGAFGYDINDQWHFDFEWRWQKDEITQDDPDRSAVTALFQPFQVGDTLVLRDEFTNFLPRLTLNYKPSDNVTLWTTYSEGNIPGFFNDQLADLTQSDLDILTAEGLLGEPFLAEEELSNLEFGWKQTAWDNKLSFSAVLYFMEWTNQKTRVGFPITRADGSQVVRNVVVGGFSTDITGLEIEGVAALTDNLTLNFSLETNDAEFQNFQCGFTDDFQPAAADGSVPCNGNTPINYPEISGSFAATWRDSLSDNSEWDYFARLDGQYKGKSYVDEANFGYIGESWLFNLRAGLEKDKLRLEAFITNLLDDDQYVSGQRWSDFSADRDTLFPFEFGSGHGVSLTPPKKRQFGTRLSYDF